jgi:hypothetical protein
MMERSNGEERVGNKDPDAQFIDKIRCQDHHTSSLEREQQVRFNPGRA